MKKDKQDEIDEEYDKIINEKTENINSILIDYKIASQFDDYSLSLQKDSESYKLNFDDLKRSK